LGGRSGAAKLCSRPASLRRTERDEFLFLSARSRVLNLHDYRSSLDNFVTEGALNRETRRPWNKQDADARWAQVQKQAITDQANCAAVASLPSLRQKLKELQRQ
jgi:hypothetical protein